MMKGWNSHTCRAVGGLLLMATTAFVWEWVKIPIQQAEADSQTLISISCQNLDGFQVFSPSRLNMTFVLSGISRVGPGSGCNVVVNNLDDGIKNQVLDDLIEKNCARTTPNTVDGYVQGFKYAAAGLLCTSNNSVTVKMYSDAEGNLPLDIHATPTNYSGNNRLDNLINSDAARVIYGASGLLATTAVKDGGMYDEDGEAPEDGFITLGGVAGKWYLGFSMTPLNGQILGSLLNINLTPQEGGN